MHLVRAFRTSLPLQLAPSAQTRPLPLLNSMPLPAKVQVRTVNEWTGTHLNFSRRRASVLHIEPKVKSNKQCRLHRLKAPIKPSSPSACSLIYPSRLYVRNQSNSRTFADR